MEALKLSFFKQNMLITFKRKNTKQKKGSLNDLTQSQSFKFKLCA